MKENKERENTMSNKRITIKMHGTDNVSFKKVFEKTIRNHVKTN